MPFADPILAQAFAPLSDPLVLSAGEWRIALAAVAGLFGLLVGSFLNVCIYRVPAGLSIVTPRSYCYSCGTMVSSADNIPILSYLRLGGCCRHCGAPFSPRYMMIEAFTGLLFAFLAWRFAGTPPYSPAGPNGAMVAYMIFASFLIVATFTDIDHFIIPDGVSYGSGVAMVLLTALVGAEIGGLPSGLIHPIATGWPFETVPILGQGGWIGAAANSALGAVFGYAMLRGVGVIGTIIFRKEAMGMGDVKLMLGIGAALGPVLTIVAFFAACVVGASISTGYIAAQMILRRGRAQPLRDSFGGAEGPMSLARREELAAMEREESGDAAPAKEAEAPEGGEGAAEDSAPDEARSAEDADPLSPAALGRLLARQSTEKRPYAFRHLPFGPYLAIGSMLALIFHARVVGEIDAFMVAVGFRDQSAIALVAPEIVQTGFSMPRAGRP
jgi:leader peptidase (prepilin peptidase)/N-methyltransferase